MALSAPKIHTHTGRTAGATVTTAEYPDGFVGVATPVYVDRGSGNIGIDFTAVASGSGAMVRDNGQGDTKWASLTFTFTISSLSQAMEISHIRNSSAKISNWLLNLSGGNPVIQARGGGDIPIFSAANIAYNTAYRAEMAVDAGTTASNGRTQARVTRISDSVVIASGEVTTLDNGAINTSHHQSGKVGATGTVGLIMDDIGFDDSAYAYVVMASPPVIATPTQSVRRRLDFSASTGGPSTLSVTQTSGPSITSSLSINGMLAEFTDINGRTTDIVLQATLTNGSAQTDSTSVTVTPLTTSGTVTEAIWNGSSWQ